RQGSFDKLKITWWGLGRLSVRLVPGAFAEVGDLALTLAPSAPLGTGSLPIPGEGEIQMCCVRRRIARRRATPAREARHPELLPHDILSEVEGSEMFAGGLFLGCRLRNGRQRSFDKLKIT
ncbi:MAG: hypothetical protein EA415_02770, partial [Sphaerobacteraceae bacterium]